MKIRKKRRYRHVHKRQVCTCRSTKTNIYSYLRAQKVEVAAVGAEVEEVVTCTKKAQFVSITPGRGTVYLSTKKSEGGAGGGEG